MEYKLDKGKIIKTETVIETVSVDDIISRIESRKSEIEYMTKSLNEDMEMLKQINAVENIPAEMKSRIDEALITQ